MESISMVLDQVLDRVSRVSAIGRGYLSRCAP